jgi:hypothetical protein
MRCPAQPHASAWGYFYTRTTPTPTHGVGVHVAHAPRRAASTLVSPPVSRQVSTRHAGVRTPHNRQQPQKWPRFVTCLGLPLTVDSM